MGLRANVAQLFRALPCQGRGRELESLHSHHFLCSRDSFFCWLTLGPSVRESRVSSFAPFFVLQLLINLMKMLIAKWKCVI